MANFTEDVDILGLRFVGREDVNKLRKGIYVMLILFGSGFAAYQLYDQVRTFKSTGEFRLKVSG